jgi:hypothetical protein
MMKILFIIGILAVLGVLGLVWLYRAGSSTRKEVIGEITNGKDRLTLHAVYTSHWGNSYSARTLSFNEHLVDFRGSLLHRENEGNKHFPLDARNLRVEVLDSAHAPALKQAERMQEQVTYLAGHVPYDLLKKNYPDLEEGTPWTVWVKPDDFSAAEYQRMATMLRQQGPSLREQQQQFERDTARNPYQWLRYPGLIIWRMVYHDYGLLKNQVFERKNDHVEEKVVIAPHGDAEFRHTSERYKFGYGCGLGRLSETADTLLISPLWQGNDVTFPITEFAQFKNAEGKALTEVYRLRLLEE